MFSFQQAVSVPTIEHAIKDGALERMKDVMIDQLHCNNTM
jgi:hypothetical protein